MSVLDFLVICIILSVINAGFLNANIRADIPPKDSRMARYDLAFCVGISLIPVVWLITPFVTGFYMDGWTLSGDVEE